MTQPNPRLSSMFKLEYPQSVGVYDGYPQAQAAVDFLADAKFAVQNLAIVGTDLKSVERVTGRRNWGTVMVTGLQSGLSTGLMVALILWFLQPQMNPLMLLPGALLIGIVIGITFAAIGYAASRGKRDFNSISQTVAAKYEVLCEHKLAAQARELLAGMPGARAAQFDPRTQPAPWQDQPQYSSQGGYPVQSQQPAYGQGQQPAYGQGQQPVYDQGQQPGYGQGQQPGYDQGQQPSYDQNRPPTVRQDAPESQQPYSAPPQQGGDDRAPSAASAPQQSSAADQPYGNQPYGSYGSRDGIGHAPESDDDDARRDH